MIDATASHAQPPMNRQLAMAMALDPKAAGFARRSGQRVHRGYQGGFEETNRTALNSPSFGGGHSRMGGGTMASGHPASGQDDSAPVWLLDNGSWHDSGQWVDTRTWTDG